MDNQEREVVTVKDINGCLLKTYKSSHHAKHVRRYGTYEPALYYFLNDYLSRIKDPVCLDVGAHIGGHTVTMSKLSKHVLAFEPSKGAFKLLQGNVERSKFNNVRIFNKALSNKTTTSELYYLSEKNPGRHSLVSNSHKLDSETVKLVKGDDIVEQEKITKVDFIKIDVEGHEGEVAQGLETTILKDRPVLVIEWNNEHTKNYFCRNNLFSSLFKDYSAVSLTNSQELRKEKLYNNIRSKRVARLCVSVIRRVYSSKGYSLTDFEPTNNYLLVLLCPNEIFNSKFSCFNKELIE